MDNHRPHKFPRRDVGNGSGGGGRGGGYGRGPGGGGGPVKVLPTGSATGSDNSCGEDGRTTAAATAAEQGEVVLRARRQAHAEKLARAHAERRAGDGFRVIVPDLYRGELGVEAEEAQHLMDGLDL